jgi:pimeloyl-ACP methyl ester carboxylesterase
MANSRTEIVHETVDLGDVKLHVARAGQGPLMLFLHGFPEFWRAWQAQLEEFGADFLAVAPDQRGYNLSDKPADLAAYRPDKLIADIGKLADHYAPGQTFTLVAHDWGGAIAWGYAIAQPQRLDKLVIINAPHPGRFAEALRTDKGQQAASQYMRFFRDPSAESVLSANNFQTLWERTFAPLHAAGMVDDAFKAEYLAAWGQPGALTGGLNWYRATPMRPPSPEGQDGPARHRRRRLPGQGADPGDLGHAGQGAAAGPAGRPGPLRPRPDDPPPTGRRPLGHPPRLAAGQRLDSGVSRWLTWRLACV